MKLVGALGSISLALATVLPAAAQAPPSLPAGGHDAPDAFDEPDATQYPEAPTGPRMMRRPGMPAQPGAPGAPMAPHGMMRGGIMGRPLVSMMLHHRVDLGLSPQQVLTLEKLRDDYLREAIRRDADRKLARLDLGALLRPDPADPAKAVDMPRVEAKIRDIEKIRGDAQLARLRTIEAAKAQLTPDQRVKLAALLAQMRMPMRPTGPPPGAPAPAPSRS